MLERYKDYKDTVENFHMYQLRLKEGSELNLRIFYKRGTVKFFSMKLADLFKDLLTFETGLIRDIFDPIAIKN